MHIFRLNVNVYRSYFVDFCEYEDILHFHQ